MYKTLFSPNDILTTGVLFIEFRYINTSKPQPVTQLLHFTISSADNSLSLLCHMKMSKIYYFTPERWIEDRKVKGPFFKLNAIGHTYAQCCAACCHTKKMTKYEECLRTRGWEIFVPKRDEATGNRIKLHNEKFMICTHCRILIYKSYQGRWDGWIMWHTQCRREMHTECWL